MSAGLLLRQSDPAGLPYASLSINVMPPIWNLDWNMHISDLCRRMKWNAFQYRLYYYISIAQ